MRPSDFRDAFRLKSTRGIPPVLMKFGNVSARDLVLKSSVYLREHKLSVRPQYTERKMFSPSQLKIAIDKTKRWSTGPEATRFETDYWK